MVGGHLFEFVLKQQISGHVAVTESITNSFVYQNILDSVCLTAEPWVKLGHSATRQWSKPMKENNWGAATVQSPINEAILETIVGLNYSTTMWMSDLIKQKMTTLCFSATGSCKKWHIFMHFMSELKEFRPDQFYFVLKCKTSVFQQGVRSFLHDWINSK